MTALAINDRLNDLRQRVLKGETISKEEYAEVIASLRAKRTGDIAAAAEVKKTKAASSKAKAAPVDLDALLGDLIK